MTGTTPRSRPAKSGERICTAESPASLRPLARPNWLSGTSRTTEPDPASRETELKAEVRAFARQTCQSSNRFEESIRISISVLAAARPSQRIMVLRRSQRSTRVPASGGTSIAGSEAESAASESAVGEWVSR